MTKLSILTISFNNIKGLKKTVDSVLAQTSQEFEYIVIDGNSADGTKEYLAGLKNIPNLKYISETDTGIYNAMNKGAKMASGEYLQFLNSGDEFANNKIIAEVLPHLRQFDFIYGDINFVNDIETKTHHFPANIEYSLFLKSSLGHPTTFINRNVFIQNGQYDESLKIVSDWKFFFHALINKKCTYKKIEIVLVNFYLDGISSINASATENEKNKVIDSEFWMYKRLYELEYLHDNVRKSRILKALTNLGFLAFLKKYL